MQEATNSLWYLGDEECVQRKQSIKCNQKLLRRDPHHSLGRRHPNVDRQEAVVEIAKRIRKEDKLNAHASILLIGRPLPDFTESRPSLPGLKDASSYRPKASPGAFSIQSDLVGSQVVDKGVQRVVPGEQSNNWVVLEDKREKM